MKITKLGHCCMYIEENGVKLLTDPGTFTAEKQSEIVGLDAVIFTHEHADHFHLQSLRAILKNNPECIVICNPGVAALLSKEGIAHEEVGEAHSIMIKGVTIEGHGTTHAEIHSSLPPMQNTGYMIAGRLWYPGDALSVDPGIKPDILALPIAGPWMKVSDAVDYALRLMPKATFPVHDMIMHSTFGAFLPQIVTNILEPRGVRFYAIELDKEYEF